MSFPAAGGLPGVYDGVIRRKAGTMGSTVLYMSMSLDGFIAGPDDGPEQGLGVDGERLHDWIGQGDPAFRPEGVNAQVFDEMLATGAVVVGRRTFEIAGEWGGEHHDGVPIFVLTHEVPDEPPPGSVRYVTDVDECAALARAAAGDNDVMVHGAGAGQALLRAGQLDELELHVVPVLLGQGRRLFDNLPAEHIELDLVRRLTTPEDAEPAQHVTHLRYRVPRPS
jgi:dihydrofolate reductase